MSSERYNTVVGITAQITDLNGFHRVLRERRDAGYDRKERLTEFVVLGRWMLDTCGNCGLIDLWDGDSRKDATVSPGDLVYFKGKKVLTLDDLRTVFRYENESEPGFRLSWTPGTRPMLSSDECGLCEKGWDLQNCHDAEMVRGDEKEPRFMHRLCYRAHRANQARERFDGIFFLAGFTKIRLLEIPNQYCPCILCEPWYRVETEVGTIEIGWRKRVINIDWSRTRQDLLHLFPDENVTKEANYIHAYGDAMAEQYLRRIREELSRKRATG